MDLTVIIVINKVDRPDARLDEVVDEVLELLLDLDASDEQLDSPGGVLLRRGRALLPSAPISSGSDLTPLFETILEHIAAARGRCRTRRCSMLVSSVDYNDFVGRIGVGRITARHH